MVSDASTLMNNLINAHSDTRNTFCTNHLCSTVTSDSIRNRIQLCSTHGNFLLHCTGQWKWFLGHQFRLFWCNIGDDVGGMRTSRKYQTIEMCAKNMRKRNDSLKVPKHLPKILHRRQELNAFVFLLEVPKDWLPVIKCCWIFSFGAKELYTRLQHAKHSQ